MPKGASSQVVDFGAIEDGGGAKPRVPEGDYRAKIKAVKFATSGAGNPMFIWTIVGTDGKLKGKELTDYTALTTKALWKLRDLLEAVAGKAPGGSVDTKKLLDHCKKQVGKELGITLTDDEYTNDKGKTYISSKISDYLSIGDMDDSAPDVEDDDVEDEDEDETTEDDGLEEMDRAELKAHIKSEGLDITVKKSMSDDDIRAAITAASEDDEEEEIEDVDLDEL